MRNILLTISYDGTDFCGWQRQDFSAASTIPKDEKKRSAVSGEVRTVQSEIEKALKKLHGENINLYGSGRTDSGVHAYAQAANFFSPIDSIPVENYPRALNAFLTPEIRILSAAEKDENFNARFSASSRVYRYFINFSESLSASQTRYVWNVKNYEPSIDRLNKFISDFKGETDCASFAASGDKSKSTFRYIENARFFFQKDLFGTELLVFEIEANAFLWKMVRTLTGTLINLDKNNALPDSFNKILNEKSRPSAGITAPPTGLFLWKVKFDERRLKNY